MKKDLILQFPEGEVTAANAASLSGKLSQIIGTSVIPDYELLFKGSKTGSYLTIEPKAGASVPVAAWEVNEDDELALDRYEGFPDFYYKAEMVLPIKGIRTGKVRRRKNSYV